MFILLTGMVTLFGLGLPALRLMRQGDGVERLCAVFAFALGAIGLFGAIAYGLDLPRVYTWALPALGTLMIWRYFGDVSALFGSPGVKQALRTWAVLYLFGGLLSTLIVSYSGGGWSGDWLEHYERTLYFIHHWPKDTLFIQYYQLPARPPLINLIEAQLLAPHSAYFFNFQLVAMLLASLAAFPLLALLRRLIPANHEGIAHWGLVLVLVSNAAWNQNFTFVWTKLPTAFLILTAIVFLVGANPTRTRDEIIAWSCVGLACLAHYSSIIWAVAFYVATLGCLRSWRQGLRRPLLQTFLIAPCLVLVVVTPWFLYSYLNFGNATILATSTATEFAPSISGQCWTALHNLWNTLVPFVLRPSATTTAYVDHVSIAATLRDYVFSCYQLNIILSCGLAGLAVFMAATRGLPQFLRSMTMEDRFLVVCILLVVPLGTAVHSAPDEFGLAHICLQPLILLFALFVTVQLQRGGRSLRYVIVTLLFLDFIIGTALHFHLQSLAETKVLGNQAADISLIITYGNIAAANLREKIETNTSFIGDHFRGLHMIQWGLVVAAYAGISYLALSRTPVQRPVRQDKD